MALFGFNKQKVLATAEKYVQQGKLQNAISEYEKILKNDAKDLTVTNTVGDLYSRLGESDKATQCFKNVGDAYASQGFTVKAIAMYKKICKLQPSLESLLKLAELYTQQGLFNDARAQYLQVAEEFLKAGELENAVRIFQKILEMDPENSAMRVKLAEVYVRLGKKTEAWQIFSAAAESLRSKGQLPAADEVLQRMLTLDPGNAYALQLQGKTLLESGDAAAAAATLSKIPDIDSNAEGMRDLLRAYLQTGQLSEAGTVANKLLTVHNDLNAISSFADALMQAGQYENALQVFDQHAERMLAENSDKVLESLHTIIGHVRDNPDSLQKLLDLFNKAGENTHVSEVMELLAHASVQAGDLSRSRDLYQKLSQLEPQNPLHMQNYQQVVNQIGGATGGKLITPEEAVVLIDDLEATAPSVHQHYSDETALAIRSALTDAELFISYNMPAKALGPLVSALPLAPNDLRLNQRLAALHTRAGRFAEAAVCCRTLQNVYSDADHPEEATRYGELAERYEERSSGAVHHAPRHDDQAPIYIDAAPVGAHAAPEAEAHESTIPEFSIDDSTAEITIEDESTPVEAAAEVASPWPTASAPEPVAEAPEAIEEITVETAEPEFAVVEESIAPAAEVPPSEQEIDLSSEWDDSVTVEADAPVAEAAEVEVAEVPEVAEVAEIAVPEIEVEESEIAAAVGAHDVPESNKVDETTEEIRFYLAHGMPEQAMAALAKLQTLTSDKAKIEELRSEVEAATEQHAEELSSEPNVEELPAEDVPAIDVEAEAPAAEEPVHEMLVAQHEFPEPPAAPTASEDPVEVAEVAVEAEPEPEPVAEAEPEPQHGVLKEFVTDLESSLGDEFLPGTVAKSAAPAPATTAPIKIPAAAKPAAPQVQPAVAATSAPVLGEFVADIEASLGDDFLKAAPVPPAVPAATAKPQPIAPPVPVVAPAITPSIPAAKPVPPMAASAAASASPVAPTSSWPSPAVESKPKTAVTPIAAAPGVPAVAVKASPFAEDAGIDLAEMFGELKQDLEADVASADEDPETHYNLGIAFREMGLLDEAIGELQKACQSFDRGRPFPQIMQTYTWLAQCFLEKQVPEAAVRWYEKALQVPSIDGETRTALNYELAAAYETSGDKTSALKHFMDVYGSNIDYRDVSERIKALKS